MDPPIGPKLPPSARCRVEACPFPNNPSCAGDSLEVCDLRANAKQRFRCGAIGLKCVEVEGPTTASNIAFCATPGVHETSCQEQAQSGATCTLDGKSIVLCSREGHFRNPMAEEVVFSAVQSVYTCPEGWACEGASDVSSFAYCRSLEGCSPQDTRDRGCDGASVEVCLGGRLRTIDCAEGGMVCRDDQGRGAWCVFP